MTTLTSIQELDPSNLDFDADAERMHRRRWKTLSVLCLSLVLICIDNTILNVAIPTLAREFHATASQLQWIVDSYILVFAGLLLTAGFVGDKFGRRGALMSGMVIFGIGSIAASMAGSASQLIACRALMGVGGALIMPATLSILTNVFRDPKERAKAIAIWAGCSGLGVALGPVTGGWLIEHFSWGSVFLVNLPVLLLALVGSALVVPPSRDLDAPKLDIGGACLSMAGLTLLLWAIIEAPEHGWTNSRTMVTFGGAAVVLALFIAWERRQQHPMLNLAFFRNRRFSAASGAVTLTFFALFGTLFLLSQYMQSVMGYTAFQSGVRYLPLAATLLVISPQSAKLGGTVRFEGRRRRRARHGRRRNAADPSPEHDLGIRRRTRIAGGGGRRDGPDDGTGNGIHHGFAPPGAGRRRFCRERHDPRDRRRPRASQCSAVCSHRCSVLEWSTLWPGASCLPRHAMSPHSP